MWVAPVILSQASNAGQPSAIDEIGAALSFAEEGEQSSAVSAHRHIGQSYAKETKKKKIPTMVQSRSSSDMQKILPVSQASISAMSVFLEQANTVGKSCFVDHTADHHPAHFRSWLRMWVSVHLLSLLSVCP